LKGEVHVWRAELDAPGWPGPEGLPAPERERAGKMRQSVAARWIAARWSLRYVLARYLEEEPSAIELALGPHGKPRLATSPERLRFNLSHSGEIALVALSVEHEVGVDVERVRPRRDAVALAERALGPEDVAVVQAATAEERMVVFHQRWACHEARLKCLGVGLGAAGPEEPGPVAVEAIDLGSGYAAAIAVATPEPPPLRVWTFDASATKSRVEG
jgi:4'-phosphopantetheinyl transferase